MTVSTPMPCTRGTVPSRWKSLPNPESADFAMSIHCAQPEKTGDAIYAGNEEWLIEQMRTLLAYEERRAAFLPGYIFVVVQQMLKRIDVEAVAKELIAVSREMGEALAAQFQDSDAGELSADDVARPDWPSTCDECHGDLQGMFVHKNQYAVCHACGKYQWLAYGLSSACWEYEHEWEQNRQTLAGYRRCEFAAAGCT